ncbi:hypothetical protein JMN32_04905 [Fulvivirga sp. 29W222]|uniref:DUF6989 domain-containing protein n=1 Tax=Fulvivirga marina TaxID=2494733 RepID=A0A937KAK8_9BACT|nr:hypothetical protein [Fulvivirga marina]MBL6445636.1 hypothetical protein [Fulvivirga marina]
MNKKTTWFIVISQAIMVLWSVISSITHAGTSSVYIITLGSFVVYVAYALITKNILLQKLLLFGFVAGVLELFADHYSVSVINTLIYPTGESMIWTSPSYMPISWTIALTQLGYYALLLTRWKGIWVAVVVISLSGGLYIPLYEHLAKNANWWYYENCSMIYSAPYYIITCEALLSAALPFLIQWTQSKKLVFAVIPGAIQGLWILLSAIIAYNIAP